MAINHSKTEKETRKAKIAAVIYVLIAIILITIPAILKQNNTNEQDNSNNNGKDYTMVCIQPNLESIYTTTLENLSKQNKYKVEVRGENPECNIYIHRNNTDINSYKPLTNKIYTVVGRYDNPINNIPQDKLIETLTTQRYLNQSIIWDNQTDTFLKTAFKNIGVGQRVLSENEIIKQLEQSPNTVAIVPFEYIKLGLKVISVENSKPLDPDFNTLRYPLIDRYWIKGNDEKIVSKLTEEITKDIQSTNYNPNNLRTILLSGSSAIGSGIQQQLYLNKGIDYISPNIRNLISNADLAQINNESSIFDPCIQTPTTSKYCTLKNNLSLIKELGFKVVGVNGNHIMDINYQSYLDTLEYYNQNELQYYAGGKNLEDAWTARVVDVKGLKFGFIGFNFLYPFSYYATKTTAGSANVDLTILKNTIENAKKESDIIIVDMNWGYEYDQRILQYQVDFAQATLENGADIVIGTQSRKIQQIDIFDNGQIILYGLGSFLPHTYTNSENALYTLTYYQDKPINLTIHPIVFNNNIIDLATGTELDTLLKKVYSIINLK